jgi:hypothetical protein
VRLQAKEVNHLIRCGALDGLGKSRAELQIEAQDVVWAGNALQLALPFDRPEVTSESASERLTWERQVLGIPVSVHPLELRGGPAPDWLPLRGLMSSAGRHVVTAGARLPGWTGGTGFFLGDGDTFVIARQPTDGPSPRPWEPLVIHGRWVCAGPADRLAIVLRTSCAVPTIILQYRTAARPL